MGAQALIGVSAHSLAEAEAAEAAGADYLTLSPAFATPSKPGYGPALGPGGLKPITRAVSIPVLALAGVTAANVGACLAAGAAGVAVMGGVMGARNPEQAVGDIVAALE
jgi:thiamine-phosphate pyrophosphorylase